MKIIKNVPRLKFTHQVKLSPPYKFLVIDWPRRRPTELKRSIELVPIVEVVAVCQKHFYVCNAFLGLKFKITKIIHFLTIILSTIYFYCLWCSKLKKQSRPRILTQSKHAHIVVWMLSDNEKLGFDLQRLGAMISVIYSWVSPSPERCQINQSRLHLILTFVYPMKGFPQLHKYCRNRCSKAKTLVLYHRSTKLPIGA